MEEFGCPSEKIKEALMRGIAVKNEKGRFEAVSGVVSLAYHKGIGKFALVFGSCAQNASYAIVDEIGRTWRPL